VVERTPERSVGDGRPEATFRDFRVGPPMSREGLEQASGPFAPALVPLQSLRLLVVFEQVLAGHSGQHVPHLGR
jgi:hypothetical protein